MTSVHCNNIQSTLSSLAEQHIMAHRRAGLQVGSIHKGTVSRIESFGVFVDVSEDGHSERGQLPLPAAACRT